MSEMCLWSSSSDNYEWGGLHKVSGGIWGWLWERSGLVDQWGNSEWGPGKSGLSVQCNLYTARSMHRLITFPVSTFCLTLLLCFIVWNEVWSAALLTADQVLNGSLTLLCESIVSSVELRKLAGTGSCLHAKPTLLTYRHSVTVLDAILMNTLIHVCYQAIMPVTR